MGLSLAELVPYLVIAGQLWILLKVFSTFASVQHAISNRLSFIFPSFLPCPLSGDMSGYRGESAHSCLHISYNMV